MLAFYTKKIPLFLFVCRERDFIAAESTDGQELLTFFNEIRSFLECVHKNSLESLINEVFLFVK